MTCIQQWKRQKQCTIDEKGETSECSIQIMMILKWHRILLLGSEPMTSNSKEYLDGVSMTSQRSVIRKPDEAMELFKGLLLPNYDRWELMGVDRISLQQLHQYYTKISCGLAGSVMSISRHGFSGWNETQFESNMIITCLT